MASNDKNRSRLFSRSRWKIEAAYTGMSSPFQPLRDALTQNTYSVIRFMPEAVLRRNQRMLLEALRHALPRDIAEIDRWLDVFNMWTAELTRRKGEAIIREILE